MNRTLLSHLLPMSVACAGLLALAGCGSSSTSTSSASTASAQPSSSSSAAANGASAVALSASDLPSSISTFVQASDGLLGTTANTDSRVFASSDNSTRVEVDIADDTGAAAASTDYTAYQGAAAKQVPTQSGTSTPSIGQSANEYVGTDANGHSAVSLSFVEGSFIVVVTMVSSSSTVDPTVVETIAHTQDSKITAA